MSDQIRQPSEILIAQREPFLLRVLERGLGARDRKLVAMMDGQQVLDRVRVNPPSVLIVDLDLAPMGGEELCRRLQTEVPQREFLTCVLTHSAEDQYGNFSEWFSNFRLMEKPLSVGLLNRYINDQLSETAA
ncbi:MAG: response regulator [Pseudomonadota bacterium]